MSTQANPVVNKAVEQLAPFLATKQEVSEAAKSAAAAAERADGAVKQLAETNKILETMTRTVAEMRIAPAFISPDSRAQAKAGKEYSLGRLLWAQSRKRLTGEWPSEAKFAREIEYLRKALSEGTTTAGGFLIPEEWSADILPELGAQAVVLQANPVQFPISVDKFHVPGFNADATAEWLGENVGSTESQPTTREVVLTLSTARLYTVASIEWMRDANPATDSALRANLTRALQRFVDKAYLEGSGSNRPTGLGAIASINSIGADNDNADGGEINIDDLLRAVKELDLDNAPQDRRAFFMHPRSWYKVAQLKDQNGRYLVEQDVRNMAQKQLFGYPVFTSTQMAIDQTKGSGTALSTILLAAMSDILVGIGSGGRGIELAVSEDAEFKAAGVAVRLLFRTDIQAGHPQSICAITGVK